MEKYICIHGHFYQPPRENPWLEEVEIQDSAAPYHDWNERITAECYEPNAAARILGEKGRINDIVNNYARISFNFGPTLLSWMERHKPDVYQAILKADKLSLENYSGHGSALAQSYNHIIMPLANRRDKITQIQWGIGDFESRFNRKPEGMWLSEAAVDLETLDIMAEEGIRFTILDSNQAHQVKMKDKKDWHDVSGGKIDPRMPYECKLPSGKSIAIFFYDSPISRDVAFSGLLNSGESFANRLMQPFTEDTDQDAQLVHIATDGETYGHHHRYGDMALAYCLHHIESNNLASISIYGEYLEKFPPTHEVQIVEESSWSCFHGVERWRSNCGCNSGMNPGWTQEWRKPLREALDQLRDQLTPFYERAMSAYVQDPWLIRNEYIQVVLDRSDDSTGNFFGRFIPGSLKKEDKVKILKLLEMQRHAMLMYTSCGWFFDELSGIETVQVMHYAAKAMQLAQELFGVQLEGDFLEQLRNAPSNVVEYGNGETIWEEFVHPGLTDLRKVGAHYAITSLFDHDQIEENKIYCYSTNPQPVIKENRGEEKLAIGKIDVRSDITLEEAHLVYAVLHLGGHNLVGGVRHFLNEDAFIIMQKEVKLAFDKGDMPETIRLMSEHFGSQNYSIWHLFKDDQRKLFDSILETAMRETEAYFRNIYEHHYSIIQIMKKSHVSMPKILYTTVEFILNTDFNKLLERDDFDIEKLERLVTEMKKWDFKREKATLDYIGSKLIRRLMEKFLKQVTDIELLEKIEKSLGLFHILGLDLDVWKPQNIYHAISQQYYGQFQEAVTKDDATAEHWIEAFDQLGKRLHIDMG